MYPWQPRQASYVPKNYSYHLTSPSAAPCKYPVQLEMKSQYPCSFAHLGGCNQGANAGLRCTVVLQVGAFKAFQVIMPCHVLAMFFLEPLFFRPLSLPSKNIPL